MSDMSVAESLVQGWDEDDEVTQVPAPTLVDEPEVEPEEVEVEVEAAPSDEPEQPEEEEEASEDKEQEETPEEEEEEGVVARIDGFDLSDADARAYLAQYQDDPVKALRAAAELRRAYGRQGTDLASARQRAQELEYQIAQDRLLGGVATPLSQEQAEWAEGAAMTPTPGAYVQQALNAGEFDLARAVCTYWAQTDPFNAGRAGQLIDSVEGQIQMQQQAPTEAPTEVILDALYANVPGMREWEPQMVAVFNNLGPSHHLVQESRSNNIDVAMRALINIFDIAKASTANVQERTSEIKKRARAEADGAKAKAAVTSSASRASTPKEPPRSNELIMPGLTFGDLEREFAS